MTDFDKKLIEKANQMRCWDYRNIDILISIADTEEAKYELSIIRCDLHDLAKGSL